MKLDDIDFGQDTAEFDTHLADYFLETPIYERVGENLGNVGSKTACYVVLEPTSPAYCGLPKGVLWM